MATVAPAGREPAGAGHRQCGRPDGRGAGHRHAAGPARLAAPGLVPHHVRRRPGRCPPRALRAGRGARRRRGAGPGRGRRLPGRRRHRRRARRDPHPLPCRPCARTRAACCAAARSPPCSPRPSASPSRRRTRSTTSSPGTGIAVEDVTAGDVRSAGAVEWRTIWPRRRIAAGSVPNNASLVLVLTVDGRRVLLSGDIEPEAQAAVGADLQDVAFDVVKVPHHGSRYQSAAADDVGSGPRRAHQRRRRQRLRAPGAGDHRRLDRGRRARGANGSRRRRRRGVVRRRARGRHAVLSLTHAPSRVTRCRGRFVVAALVATLWTAPVASADDPARPRAHRRADAPGSRAHAPRSRAHAARHEPAARRRSPSPAPPCRCASTTADRSSPPPRSDSCGSGTRSRRTARTRTCSASR